MTEEKTITSIKGFDANLQCRGFQFEVGKTYTVEGNIEACNNGFHACPVEHHPLSVFDYYAPAGNRFFKVTQNGKTDAEGTKIASASITIGIELSLADLATRAVTWVFDRANWTDGPVATEDNEGATASGSRGAATASGYAGRARGADGSALFLVERDNDYTIVAVWAGIVGCDGIKADTFYRLTEGKPVETDNSSGIAVYK